MKRRKGNKARKASVPAKWRVTLPKEKVPDWLVQRWGKRVVRFLVKRATKGNVPPKDAAKALGLSVPGWKKFKKFGKVGPLFTSILRGCYALLERKWIIVITLEGPRIQRSGLIG